MAWSPDDVAALERAIASGVKRVRYSDREVEYRTLAEMRETLAHMKREFSPAKRARQGVPVFEKGV